jgi:release factor glutamine methyltransferase
MSQTESWTIQRLLNWTTDYFRKRDFESPRLDAEILLAHSLDCQRIQLYARFDAEPDTDAVSQFRALVKRRSAGEPVAYLVGHREFYSLDFEVDSNVLIPRPETEHLITETIDRFANGDGNGKNTQICDVGTGSGVIAITLAKHLPNAQLTATDISQAALQLAARNAQRHGVASRIEFVHSDLLNSIDPGKKFDAIVSNPPYIGENERDSISDEVKLYEPNVALFSTDADGIEITKRLINASIDRLVPSGWLLFETSPMLANRCREIALKTNQFKNIQTVNDLARRERIVVAQRV